MFSLFTFASNSLRNIELGVQHRLWAVSTLANQQSMASRIGRARNNLRPGAYGVLYCGPTHSFTTPFLVESFADPDRVVTEIWPEAWRLPFKIKPLGSPARQLHMSEAAERWPTLRERMKRVRAGGVTTAFNMTGAVVFSPVPITAEDWGIICHDLAH